MAKQIESIDEQWARWSLEHDKHKHIDTDELKETLLKDLTYASQMDVREYTLYQKWNEVHEKYPTRSITTLFGDEVQLINQTTEKDIKEIKSNIWVPESPDDYANLQPTMILSNGPLADKWNTLRTFSSTMKNNSNIGRNLYYTVVDKVTEKYLGVVCISSDFLDLTPRDNHIGWPKTVKTQGNMINHTAIGYTW